MIRIASILVVLLTLNAGLAGAEDAPAPGPPPAAAAPPAAPPAAPVPKPVLAPTPTPEQASDAVVAALAAKDDAALKALASKDDPDPWLVADELIRGGSFDAAGAFATAAPRVDTEKLPVYVASRRGTPDDLARRERLAKANAALQAGRPADALEVLGTPEPEAVEDVVGVRLAMVRGAALRATVRLELSAGAFLAAGDAGERIGWFALAAAALHEAGESSDRASAYAAARNAWERELANHKRRGDREGVARTLGDIGSVHFSLGDYEKALAAYERALAARDALGDKAGAARALGSIGIVYTQLGDYVRALSSYERALSTQESLGDKVGAAATLSDIGAVHAELEDYEKALALYERAFAAQQALGDQEGAAATLSNIGDVHAELGDHAKALSVYERTLAVQEALGDKEGAATTLGNIGNSHRHLRNFAKALAAYERALAWEESLGDGAGAALTLGRIGEAHDKLGEFAKALSVYERARQALASVTIPGARATEVLLLARIGDIHSRLGDHAKALAAYEPALAVLEALGDKAGAAATLGLIGDAHAELGDYAKALAIYERATVARAALGDSAGAARMQSQVGLCHYELGDFGEALAAWERVLVAQEVLGDEAGVAGTLGNIGNVHHSVGDFAQALRIQERALAAKEALGDQAGVAMTLGNIGTIYAGLGDYPKALAILERALAAQESLGDKGGAASTLGNIGIVWSDLGDYADALAIYERALVAKEALGDRAGAAGTLGNIGIVHYKRRDYGAARAVWERAMALQASLGDKAGAADTLGNIGNVHLSLGEYAQALSIYERALVAKEALGNSVGTASTLLCISRVHYNLRAYGKAIASARRAVSLLETTTRGLAAEEGAGARARLSGIYDVGTAASMAVKDTAGMALFLESGRAGALLEGLAARGALLEYAVPEDLRRAEATARAKETVARRALGKALEGGDAAAEQAGRAELEAASEQVASVVARIQREAKAGASIVYPVAATLDEVRATLSPGDVLVLYALFEKDAAALVVTKENARIVQLGLCAPIDAAAATATRELAHEGSEPAEVLSTLGALLIKPLELPASTKRVLVSPTGALSYVPFAVLMPDVPVTYVPSGTTYRLLREDEALQGDGVLALGDPDYGTKSDPHAMAVYAGRAAGLAPLLASREEAKAVGTVTLLGAEATEARLRSALAERKRWRSVHLACHGLVNSERPALSSLAVTAAGDDDGFLSCLDVFGMKVPADLVVLSACETGKGKVVKGEGLVGLTRAFMFAGSPRVLCSLWKVDDAATQFLMTRFYELWNPKEGPGLPASEALRRAQAAVREHEVELEDPASVATGQVRLVKVKPWAHPTFWAAWVLWGLP